MPRKPFWLHSKIIHCMYVVFLFFWKKKIEYTILNLLIAMERVRTYFPPHFPAHHWIVTKNIRKFFCIFFHSVCRKIKNFLYFFYFFFFFSTLLIWFLFFTLFLSVYNSWAEEQFMYVFVTLKSSHQVLKNVLE